MVTVKVKVKVRVRIRVSFMRFIVPGLLVLFSVEETAVMSEGPPGLGLELGLDVLA